MSLQPGLPLVTGNMGYPVQPNQFVRFVDPEVYLTEPYATPIIQIAENELRKENTTNFKFEWQKDTLRTAQMNLQAGYTGGSPTATYTDTANYTFFEVGGDIWNDTTQQLLTVTDVNTGTGVVTLATIDGTNVTTGTTGDKITYTNTPISQGGLIQTAKNTTITLLSNYIETFSTPFEVDTTTLRSKLYQGNEWTYLHGKKIQEHKWQKERKCIWGVPSAGTATDGNYMTRTGGLFFQLTDHVSYTHAGFSYALFDAWLRDHVFKFGKREKVIFMNNKAASDLNAVFVQQWRTNFPPEKESTTFQLKISKWVSGYGTVTFILMPQADVGSDANPRGMFIAVQPEYLVGRYMWNTYLMDNIQNPRALKHEAALVSQMGLQYSNPDTGSIFIEAAS